MNDHLKTAAPALVGTASGVSPFLGLTLPEWVSVLTLVYLTWAITNQVIKFWRNIRGNRQDAA